MALKYDKILGQLREKDASSGTGGAVDSVNGQTGDVVLTTNEVADSTNKRYVNDAQKTVITNTSGTNTGDQDLSGLVPKTTTVNSKALSSDITLTNTDVGAAAASHTHAQSNITNLTTDLAAKAPLASPTFTGTVTLPAGQVVNGVTLTTGGGTSNFLRADGTYAAPPGGGGGLSFSQMYAITTLMG